LPVLPPQQGDADQRRGEQQNRDETDDEIVQFQGFDRIAPFSGPGFFNHPRQNELPERLQRLADGTEESIDALPQQKAFVAALAAKVMAAQQQLALRANELSAGVTAPANGNLRVIFAGSSCHDLEAVLVLKTRS
jgi:hypothetical protein